MRKSCLAQIIVLLLLAVIVGAGIRRVLAPTTLTAPSGGIPLESASSEGKRLSRAGGLSLRALIAGVAVEEEPTAGPIPAEPLTSEGIEGLTLRLSQPLTIDVPRVGGLAVTDSFMYVAAHNPETQNALILQLDLATKAIRQMRTIAHGSRHVFGGLDAGGGHVWGCLTEAEGAQGSTVLALDEAYLEAQLQFDVQERLAAVGWLEAERIYAVDASGARFYVFTEDGQELLRKDVAGGARYGDIAVISGSLVCAGHDELGGVLDVYDPDSLTLLTRHRCTARSQGGHWVTGRGFAYRDGLFYFLPDQGSLPMLLTYSLDGVSLGQYAPGMR